MQQQFEETSKNKGGSISLEMILLSSQISSFYQLAQLLGGATDIALLIGSRRLLTFSSPPEAAAAAGAPAVIAPHNSLQPVPPHPHPDWSSQKASGETWDKNTIITSVCCLQEPAGDISVYICF